jgi:outer membrane protein TolC
MGVLAYQKGELELIDLLRLQRNSNAAERQLARLQIEQNRQIAFYNQAVGVLP